MTNEEIFEGMFGEEFTGSDCVTTGSPAKAPERAHRIGDPSDIITANYKITREQHRRVKTIAMELAQIKDDPVTGRMYSSSSFLRDCIAAWDESEQFREIIKNLGVI